MKQYLNNREFTREMNKIRKNNDQKEKLRLLREERKKFKKKHDMETSKFIAIYLFILLNAIVIFAMVAMWRFHDLSYLGVLISDIAAQVLIYAIYCMKAYHAKKQSEIMKFNRERIEMTTLEDVLEAGKDCTEQVPLTGGDIMLFSSES